MCLRDLFICWHVLSGVKAMEAIIVHGSGLLFVPTFGRGLS